MTIAVAGLFYLILGVIFTHRVVKRLETLYPRIVVSRHSISVLYGLLLVAISTLSWPILMGILFFKITNPESAYVLLNKYTISDELRNRLNIVV